MININKLFRRLSIRAKLVIAFCLLGVVPVAVVGGYGAVLNGCTGKTRRVKARKAKDCW